MVEDATLAEVVARGSVEAIEEFLAGKTSAPKEYSDHRAFQLLQVLSARTAEHSISPHRLVGGVMDVKAGLEVAFVELVPR